MIEYLLWIAGGVAFAALCRAAYRFGAKVDAKEILGRNPFIVSPEQSQPASSPVQWGRGARIPYRPGEVVYCSTAACHTSMLIDMKREIESHIGSNHV